MNCMDCSGRPAASNAFSCALCQPFCHQQATKATVNRGKANLLHCQSIGRVQPVSAAVSIQINLLLARQLYTWCAVMMFGLLQFNALTHLHATSLGRARPGQRGETVEGTHIYWHKNVAGQQVVVAAHNRRLEPGAGFLDALDLHLPVPPPLQCLDHRPQLSPLATMWALPRCNAGCPAATHVFVYTAFICA